MADYGVAIPAIGQFQLSADSVEKVGLKENRFSIAQKTLDFGVAK
ncbi:hypothetical protein ACNFIA_28875 [Pseudomonas sp. NY15437]